MELPAQHTSPQTRVPHLRFFEQPQKLGSEVLKGVILDYMQSNVAVISTMRA
jgi:hypothetical protein